MRQVAAILGLAYALMSLYAGYLLASSGIRLTYKDLDQRLLLLSGGALVLVFALILVYQTVRLMVSKS